MLAGRSFGRGIVDDWQVGDLALCVADRLPPPRDLPTNLLRIGAIYTVTSVRWSVGEQCVAIGLKEVRSRRAPWDWHASVFRKIAPHAPDAEDRITIALLNSPATSPVEV